MNKTFYQTIKQTQRPIRLSFNGWAALLLLIASVCYAAEEEPAVAEI